MTAKSRTAIHNIQEICKNYLDGQYELEIIDIYQQIKLAKEEQIIAAPTLVKKFPLPIRKFVGDLSDEEGILTGLGIPKPYDQESKDPSRTSHGKHRA